MKKVMFKWSKDLDEVFSKEEIQIATSICKVVQYHSLLGKWEPKSKWDTTSCPLRWLFKLEQRLSVCEDVEKSGSLDIAGGNVK